MRLTRQTRLFFDASVLIAGSHLDKKHLLTEALGRAGLPLTILSPGEFVRDYYHLHDDYPSSLPPRGGVS